MCIPCVFHIVSQSPKIPESHSHWRAGSLSAAVWASESFLWWPWRVCWGRGFLLGTEMLYCQLLWLWEEQTSWSDAAFFQVLASLSKNCLINPENRGKDGRRNSVSQPQSDSVELEERPIPSHLYTNFRHMLIPKGSSRWEHHSSTL